MKISSAYYCISAISGVVAIYAAPRPGCFGFAMAALLCAVAGFCAAIVFRSMGR